MNSQLATAFFNSLNNLLHNISMPKTQWNSIRKFIWDIELKNLPTRMYRSHLGTGKMRMCFHCYSFFSMILTNIFIHLLNCQWFPILLVAKNKSQCKLNSNQNLVLNLPHHIQQPITEVSDNICRMLYADHMF